MARTRFVSNASGFTMIEVMVAIAIFSIGLMAMGTLQTAALMRTGDVTRKTEAWPLLAEQAERIKQLPFYLNVGAQTHPPELDAGGFGGPRSVVSPDGRYTIQWEVADDEAIVLQNETALPGVPVGTYTVQKRITMVAFGQGGNPLAPMAQVEFFKVWWATGVP
ncbi:prepilin-type N-terminal cleavage/methylation domain-containing protein [Desulfosarcina sp.]|uniref:type IV pilus modification PilV family protein n=1 Tax=Desulfosarcina sp. TaxID=2027861 RepID=UPI0035683A0D